MGSNALIKRGVGIVELCGSRIPPLPGSILVPVVACRRLFSEVARPNPKEDDVKFLEFSKIAEDHPSRAGRLSKTFPEVPVIFRVPRGTPESRLPVSLRLGIINGWLGTQDAPELSAVSGS